MKGLKTCHSKKFWYVEKVCQHKGHKYVAATYTVRQLAPKIETCDNVNVYLGKTEVTKIMCQRCYDEIGDSSAYIKADGERLVGEYLNDHR